MKRLIISIICAGIIITSSLYANKISDYILGKINNIPSVIEENKNAYAKDKGFMYASLTEDFIPYSKDDLINIIYTAINRGYKTFTFYCPNEYENCVKDIKNIGDDNKILTHVNNFVHPYNSFTNLETVILESGEITLNINYLYTKEQIERINTEVDSIIKKLVKKENSDYDNIKTIHDYIVNNTKYDVKRNEEGVSNYVSYIAYGTLFNHKATCNGYTDLMAIFLSKMGYINYKIATTEENISYSSTGHIWNAVFLNNKWLHIDLTWDDPVADDGKDYIYHKYFLVTNEELEEADSGDVVIEEHNYDKSIYLEFNDSIKSIIS